MPAGYVFVVTYGRSGSTLLQSILNSIDGYKIVGENFNTLAHLFRSCRCLRETQDKFGKSTPPRGWQGADEVELDAYIADLIAAFVRRVLRPSDTTRISGFKEIRYTECNDLEFMNFMKFIEAHFPNAKILFNKRNAADVANSSWWKNQDSQKVSLLLKRMDNLFARASAEMPESRYLVDYDQYTTDPASLRGMFEFLGEEFDVEKIRDLLAVSV